MKKFAFYSDIAFAFLLSSLPALCYLRFLRWPLMAALLFAFLIGCITALCTAIHLRKKLDGIFLKRNERIAAEKLGLHLAILPPKECAEWILSQSNTILDGEDYRLFQQNGVYFLENKESLALCRFQAAPLTLDDVFPLLRIASNKQRILLCDELSADAHGLLKEMDVAIKQRADVFYSLKKANALPQTFLGERVFAKKRKRRSAIYFARSNSKRCLISGALLLLSSLLVPFPLYYRIFGASMMICALLLRLYGTQN